MDTSWTPSADGRYLCSHGTRPLVLEAGKDEYRFTVPDVAGDVTVHLLGLPGETEERCRMLEFITATLGTDGSDLREADPDHVLPYATTAGYAHSLIEVPTCMITSSDPAAGDDEKLVVVTRLYLGHQYAEWNATEVLHGPVTVESAVEELRKAADLYDGDGPLLLYLHALPAPALDMAIRRGDAY